MIAFDDINQSASITFPLTLHDRVSNENSNRFTLQASALLTLGYFLLLGGILLHLGLLKKLKREEAEVFKEFVDEVERKDKMHFIPRN